MKRRDRRPEFIVVVAKTSGHGVRFARYKTEAEAAAVAKRLCGFGCTAYVERLETEVVQ